MKKRDAEIQGVAELRVADLLFNRFYIFDNTSEQKEKNIKYVRVRWS